MWSGTNANRGSPANKPNNSLLGFAPPVLDVDKEVLEILDLGAGICLRSLVLGQLLLRLVDVDSILYSGLEGRNLLFETRDCVNERTDISLNWRTSSS